MESPVLFLIVFFAYQNLMRIGLVAWLLIFLLFAHYFNRIFIYPLRIRAGGGKVSIGIMLLAIIFNLTNGYLIGYHLTKLAEYDLSWFYSVPFISGLILFATGLFINWRADSILINIRKDGFIGYQIPYGFLFNKISCPNHFGEMIEWSGYALMSFSLPALAFSVWTYANLIPRALAHHKWYKSYFEDYPKNRKAFLPGIW
jgi:3-oxo-5-alpha-steroid 4-dehydrogenase 1